MTAYRRNRAERDVAQFNARFAVGEEVLYIARVGADPVRDKIMAPAEALNGQTPVAWLAGQRSCVGIGFVSKTPEAADA